MQPLKQRSACGGTGEGLAVVADKVGKLAERSSLATKEIGGLIKGIPHTVSEAVGAMEARASEVEQSHKDFHKTLLDLVETASLDKKRGQQLFTQLQRSYDELANLITDLQNNGEFFT
jgi:methyl-accepting chemotaxis protein